MSPISAPAALPAPFRPLVLGRLALPHGLLLAPLAGYTDLGFRAVCRANGAALACTEMVSAKGLFYGNRQTFELLRTLPDERPSAVQLFGSEPEVLAEVCRRPEIRAFDLLDLNMGCPMSKIVKNGEGSALMRAPEQAAKVIRACRRNFPGTLTVKFRLGWDDAHRNAPDFARMAESEGADAVTVHGRTAEQLYRGRADLSGIAAVKAAVRIPVIGNGDVVDLPSALAMAETGCDGILIGRGALGDPGLFARLLKKIPPLSRKQAAGTHFEILLGFLPEKRAVLNFRKHMAAYLRGIPDGKNLKLAALSAGSAEQMREIFGQMPD